jgi:hypothetical protein
MRPTFFIVGAPKAGTTSMAHYLIERDLSAWMPAAGPTLEEQVEDLRQPLPHGLG